ncbi:hypothetical protein TIFTF001_040064 [Ficus carica]|uniref:Uncharacterized protein n=1 Tax=Ficus carica TaxID=3494 RepID=A0AA87ZBJ0_FICCA|nr:hypothetical protein TIFTF001_040064 [Ficus carica]
MNVTNHGYLAVNVMNHGYLAVKVMNNRHLVANRWDLGLWLSSESDGVGDLLLMLLPEVAANELQVT